MIQIFVEGDSDKAFIEKYIEYLELIDTKHLSLLQIVVTQGFTKIPLLINSFQENTDQNTGINLVIFDTDDPSKTFGGFSERCKYLEEQKTDNSISFEYFLFPNHKDNGNFETLLEQMINKKHSGVFDCFNRFQNCIESHKDPKTKIQLYNTPLRKSKVFAYIDVMKKSNKDRERFKNKDFLFDNAEYWDMASSALDPLKSFLTKNTSDYLKTLP
ncbi:MAG: hypothetical protein LBR26_13685 [Prevotella sp.]|jgi:hypothetical protein|nr:hypothetical protein [Prevotella sp.]